MRHAGRCGRHQPFVGVVGIEEPFEFRIFTRLETVNVIGCHRVVDMVKIAVVGVSIPSCEPTRGQHTHFDEGTVLPVLINLEFVCEVLEDFRGEWSNRREPVLVSQPVEHGLRILGSFRFVGF